MNYEILKYPDPRLGKKSKNIDTFTSELQVLAKDMLACMKRAGGIGLAAPQVGELIQLIVIDLSEVDTSAQPLFVCNPRITTREGTHQMEEGCLSLPGLAVSVERAAKIEIQACTLEGKPFSLKAEGLFATCIQHEIDHLNGKLLVHYLSSVRRDLYKAELKRREKNPPSFPTRVPTI